MLPFVHLHVHTQYSLLDGAIRLKDLLETAGNYGMPAVAMTDHGNMYGALEFYDMAKKSGVKAIVGCEVYMAPRSRFDKQQARQENGSPAGDEDRTHHLTLLAKNVAGYMNLMKLVSAGFLEGFYYKPRIDRELLRGHGEGVIALSGCLKGEIPGLLMRNQEEEALRLASEYAEVFGKDSFYIEIQANGLREQAELNERLIAFARKHHFPLVATNDCHYLKKGDARAHEILLCIQTGKTIIDEKRMRFGTDQLYFKSPEDMYREFSAVQDALENTVEIAERCNLKLELDQHHFPVFPLKEGETIEGLFMTEVEDGLRQRLELIHKKNPDFTEADAEAYWKRLRIEIDVIRQTGFQPYFLIVSDFINWAKSHGVPVGPGRGSAAGSLVAYAMRITDLDPIEHGLLFERFLNPERVSLPDIDVDFCVIGRNRVFEYVTEKYGRDRVAQIATFGTMQARAVIRDVGRALALTYNDVDKIAKLIPAAPGMTLSKAVQLEPRLADLQKEDPQLRELFEVAYALEGLTRHASTHAAGVVMADRPIVDYMPLYRGSEGETVTQYPMKYVEKAGLIKFDFLGLRNLTVIDSTIKLIQENHGVDLHMEELPLDDKDAYDILCRADTTGVFQLESSGMRDILARLRPENFADIVALVALYRPGPLESGMVDHYIQGKHGEREVTYDLDALKPILEPTYGVILYQEQVMQIASALASYSLGEADILRRAMGKKSPEIMKEQRDRFLTGAKENKVDLAKANHIFDLMEKFAGYGFNKSHSAAYALIAYQTAYLKAHYPVEFMASLMNSFLSSTDQIVKFINECHEKKIEILPPDVNESHKDFTVSAGKIRFGLGAIKNVGEGAVEVILATRNEKGPFLSIFDFCQRMDSGKVNRRVIEQLIKSGAFDTLHENRASVLATLDEAMEKAQVLNRDRQSGQRNLFELLRPKQKQAASAEALVDVPGWDPRTTLQFERESIGFYISGHPLDFYEKQISGLCSVNTQSVPERREGAEVILAGVLTVTKELTTKKGDRMAFLTLEDKEGTLEVVSFSETYAQARALLESDDPVVVMGKVQHDEKGSKIIANRILSLEDAQLATVEAVRIRIRSEAADREALRRLAHLLMRHSGETPALLHLVVDKKAEAVIAVSPKLAVSPSKAFFEEMDREFGLNCTEVVYKTNCAA